MLNVKGGNIALSEKLYTLRKKSGLSQEQLAEQLKVSRQAISKWESGTSIPESDKLIAISNFFNVSLDYLMKEDHDQSKDTPQTEQSESAQVADRTQRTAGFIICIGGIICLIVWGLLSMLNPTASNQISESSMITIDGNGVFLILCVVAIVVGAVLLLKVSEKK